MAIVLSALEAIGIIAWRIAKAPALLVGADPQLEYAVDERIRIGRARNIANLACAPAFVAIALVAAAFVVSLAASLLPLRLPIVAA